MAAHPAETTGLVATVAEVEGRTLVEFALDGDAVAEPGTPYRVLSADGARIKGMIQVTDVPAKGRAVARVIALTDANDPPTPSDRVRELASLAEPTPANPATAIDAADEARFANLRDQYRRLLAEAISRHDAELAEARRAADARIAEAEAGLRRTLAENERAQAAELAAAKSLGGEAALAAVASEREAISARTHDALAERDRLRVEIDALTTTQQELQRRLERLTAERTEAERASQARLNAEREAREQIAGRLAGLEKREEGRASATAAMLSRDPSRSEGVLERLDRLSAETAVASERANRAEAAANEANEALLATRRQLADCQAAREAAEAKLVEVGAVDAKLATTADELAAARRETAAAKERQSASELARLEAERSLFELSARVLRLPRAGSELSALQERLRATLGARDLVPSDAKAPERLP
jgi:chromosome segregation ATPase